MTDIAQLAEAARGFTRQFGALIEFANAIESMGALSSGTADLVAAKEKAQKELEAVQSEIDSARTSLAGVRAEEAKIKKACATRVSDAEARARSIIETATATSQQAAERVQMVHRETLAGLLEEIEKAKADLEVKSRLTAAADAELATLTTAIAEVRAKLAAI